MELRLFLLLVLAVSADQKTRPQRPKPSAVCTSVCNDRVAFYNNLFQYHSDTINSTIVQLMLPDILLCHPEPPSQRTTILGIEVYRYRGSYRHHDLITEVFSDCSAYYDRLKPFFPNLQKRHHSVLSVWAVSWTDA
jgi:hypothetical protein